MIKDNDEREKEVRAQWDEVERRRDEYEVMLALLKQVGMAYQPRQVAQFAVKCVNALRTEQAARDAK